MVRSPRHRDRASSVSEILTEAEDSFSALISHARSLCHAESILFGHAGPETPHFRVAAIHPNRIVLLTPTAAWATRLRMQSEQMLRILQSSGYERIRHIDIRVAPVARETPDRKTAKQKSPAAERAFRLMADLAHDPEDKARQ